MKIQEGDFLFELKFKQFLPKDQRIETKLNLQVDSTSDRYEETLPLLSRFQFKELLTNIESIHTGTLESYSSEFENSRLAISIEKEAADEWIFTWMIAPQMILTNATEAIGIDLSQINQQESSPNQTNTTENTVEIELVISAAELQQILTQLQQDYQKICYTEANNSRLER